MDGSLAISSEHSTKEGHVPFIFLAFSSIDSIKYNRLYLAQSPWTDNVIPYSFTVYDNLILMLSVIFIACCRKRCKEECLCSCCP